MGVLASGYNVFAARAAADRNRGSKQDRVRDYVLNHAADEFRIADIRAALPGISDQAIRIVLDKLRAEDAISVNGGGPTAAWRRRLAGAPVDPGRIVGGPAGGDAGRALTRRRWAG